LSIGSLEPDINKEKAMLTNDDFRKLYLQCDGKDIENGIFADEVDILEYGRAVEEEVAAKERERCIEFVATLNKVVAQEMQDQL
jgi:hypothetical protein